MTISHFRRPLASLALITGLGVAAPAGAGAATAAPLKSFCAAVKAVGPVPAYAAATSSLTRAQAYSRAVGSYVSRVSTARNAAPPGAASAAWAAASASVLSLENDTADLTRYLQSLGSSKATISKTLANLESQIPRVHRAIGTAQVASRARGCAL